MRLYLVCRILQTADEDQLFGPAGEVPQSSLSGTVNKRRHIRCKHYFMRLVSIPNQIIKNKKRFFFWRAFSDHSFSRLTWRLSFLLVRAPSVRAGFQHRRQQQQHGLLPLITVSWCQIAVRELTQPFHKPCRMYRKRFLRMENRQREGKTAKNATRHFISDNLTYSLLHYILCLLCVVGISFLFAFLSPDMRQAAVSDTNHKPLHSGLKMLAKRRGLTVEVLRNKRPHY